MLVKSKNVEMTSGSLFKNIWRFALPLMLTNVLQQLYSAADTVVVGRYAGRIALAGVGSSSSITNMILSLLLGLSMGVSVVVGREMGAKNDKNVSRIVHTAMAVALTGGAIVSLIGICFAEFFLSLIDVPTDVMPQAKIYMQIIFAGKIPAFIYNYGSAILRAKGDSKRPLYIVTISGIMNVALNCFFVIVCGMQADGVALATVISQIFTAVSVVILLCRENDATKLFFSKIKVHIKWLSQLLRIGVPLGIQHMVFAFSNTIIHASVNSFENAAMIAGSSAASSIGNFYSSAMSAFASAAVTFTSQNIGAKKYERIKKIRFCCLADVVIVGVFIAALTAFAGKFLIGIYAPGDAETIKYGVIRLTITGYTITTLGFMNVMSRMLLGCGWSVSSMIISVVGVCGFRIMWVLTIFEQIRRFDVLMLAMPVSWLGTTLIHFVFFNIAQKKLLKS